MKRKKFSIKLTYRVSRGIACSRYGILCQVIIKAVLGLNREAASSVGKYFFTFSLNASRRPSYSTIK